MEISLARPALTLCSTAEKFGDRLTPSLQAFRSCLNASSSVIEQPTKQSAQSLEDNLGLLDDTADTISDTDILFHHISAIATVATALAFVSSTNPIQHVQNTTQSLAPSLQALRSMTDPSHLAFADAVESFMKKLSTYVSNNHPNPIRFSDGTSLSLPSPANSNRTFSQPQNTFSTTNNTVSSTTTTTATKADTVSVDSAYTAPHLVAYRSDIIEGAAVPFEAIASKIDSVLHKQAVQAANAIRQVYTFLVKASEMKSTPRDDEKQNLLKPVIKHMTDVANTASDIPPSSSIFNHIKAIEDGIGMISWIAATEKPMSFVSDADAAASFYTNKVLMASKKLENGADHKAFVEALKNLFTTTKAYIKEYHTMGVKYGIGVDAKDADFSNAKSPVSVAGADADDEDSASTYVTEFQQLIDGPLAAYVSASQQIDTEVHQQALAFAAAWNAEADFLAKAYVTPKPDDFQSMLTPISEKMGEVISFAEKVDPRGPVAQHCNALSESVAALGWVAVDEKATAYVGDMAGAGQFFMDKVKMNAKKTSSPDAHRTWAKSLETLFADLKAYVKEHHTQKLVWNPPKTKKTVSKTRAVAMEDDNEQASDYVSAFKDLINGPLAEFVNSSKALGGDVEQQAAAFAGAWEAEAEFLAKAISMPKPDDFQDMLAPIATKMGEVAAIVEKTDPRGPFAQHCNALGESVAALGWVAVDEKATGYVGDMAGAGQFFMDKVKMGAKKTDNAEAHMKWAKSLESLFTDLKAYVKEHHTQKLTWNPPKAKAPIRKTNTIEETSSATDYVTAFKNLVSGPLEDYLKLSKVLGAEVEEQAKAFSDAWKAESEFLEKAINMKKPADVQEMLTPIGTKMGEVASIVEKVDPRGPFAQHCNAIGESVAALGWVAVEEKATAYVGDMAGAGQFFLDKVKMGARKTDNPAAHKEWTQSVETLFADLKAYVKEYHTQRLTWKL